jgi:hypothetical protein
VTILKTKNLSTVLYLKSGNCLNGLKSSVLKLRHYLKELVWCYPVQIFSTLWFTLLSVNVTHKPITNTTWVRDRLCKLQKGCVLIKDIKCSMHMVLK